MAKDICSGHLLVTERTFQRFQKPQLDKIAFELERMLRSVRAEQAPQDDRSAIQDRQRRMQRLNTARMILTNTRRRLKR